jgi:hypothetical protein
MTITFTEDVDTLSPFVGDQAPVLFGIEHEYNLDYDPDDYCSCDYDDCDYSHPDEDFSPPSLPPGWDQHEEHCGWEVKSPPMRDIGEALSTFRTIGRQLNHGHSDCGFHIHLNADPEQGPAVNVVEFGRNWLAHRETLWRHCPSDDGYVGIDGGRKYAGAMPELDRWMDTPERHYEVNWTALGAHCTLEVRLARATSNMEHFELWLRYVLAVADMSLLDPDTVDTIYAGHVRRITNAWGGAFYNAPGRHLEALGTDPVRVQALAVGGV